MQISSDECNITGVMTQYITILQSKHYTVILKDRNITNTPYETLVLTIDDAFRDRHCSFACKPLNRRLRLWLCVESTTGLHAVVQPVLDVLIDNNHTNSMYKCVNMFFLVFAGVIDGSMWAVEML